MRTDPSFGKAEGGQWDGIIGKLFRIYRGPVVQLVERYNGIVEVKGSTPFRSTIF